MQKKPFLREPRDAPVIIEGLFSYQIGGSERVGADLAIEFKRRGYNVVCFAFYDSDGPIRKELEQAGIRCLDLNYEKYGRLTRRITYQMRLWRLFRQLGASALHVHHATALILCGLAGRAARVNRVVMTEHGLHQLIERPKYRRAATRYCRFADAITAVETTQVEYFAREMKVAPSKLHTVANGVRIRSRTAEQRKAMRDKLGIADDVFAFFYVGRLSPVKGLDTLLQAISMLPELSKSVMFYLVGDGSERASLELQRKELHLENRVQMLGARTDVADILSAADAFVMSSVTEGLPMALLEAMAAGLPCLATAVGGIPELLADGRGMVVPPRAPDALAQAMAQIATSAELRETMRANELERIRRFYSLDAVTDEYLRLLGLPSQWNGSKSS